MSIESFPCPRCRRVLAVTAICTCAVSLVAPIRHWPFMAADMPHTHQEQAPAQFPPSLTITNGSTVNNSGATFGSIGVEQFFAKKKHEATKSRFDVMATSQQPGLPFEGRVGS
jgi:hypothetical protein